MHAYVDDMQMSDKHMSQVLGTQLAFHIFKVKQAGFHHFVALVSVDVMWISSCPLNTTHNPQVGIPTTNEIYTYN